MKHRILFEKSIYSPLFTSNLVMDEPGRPQEYNQWFDFYFLGKDKFTVYCGLIVTAQKKLWELCEETAFDRIDAMLTEEEHNERRKSPMFVPASFSDTGKATSFVLKRNEKKYENFGNRTYYEMLSHIEKQIIENEYIPVKESFKLDRKFQSSIGVYIVVDAEFITKEVIEKSIARFKEVSYSDWESADPVPYEHLQRIPEMDYYRRIKT